MGAATTGTAAGGSLSCLSCSSPAATMATAAATTAVAATTAAAAATTAADAEPMT